MVVVAEVACMEAAPGVDPQAGCMELSMPVTMIRWVRYTIPR